MKNNYSLSIILLKNIPFYKAELAAKIVKENIEKLINRGFSNTFYFNIIEDCNTILNDHKVIEGLVVTTKMMGYIKNNLELVGVNKIMGIEEYHNLNK